MAETRIALVTGANKGIGLEIVRQLARLGMMTVIGARNKAKGEEAAASLRPEGLDAPVVEIDVSSPDSVRAGFAEVTRMFGRLDVLVNNAGVMLDRETTLTTIGEDVIAATFVTNVLGPLRMMQLALPGMTERGYGRVINLSSGMGQLAEMGGGYLAYRLSKTALNTLTRVAAAEAAATPNVKINSMCPGWVKTDMGGANATRSLAEGADTAVWLATLPDDGPSGGFFRDRKPIAW